MKVTITIALLLDLSVGAFGTTCSPGYKLKKTLTGLTCDAAKTDAASCNTNCCEPDGKTCGGLNTACAGNKYTYPANAKQPVKDAWSARAATATNQLTACCTAKAKCSAGGYNCPAGKKKNSAHANWATFVCATDPASCADSAECCVADTKKCGGMTQTDQGGAAAVPACDAGTAKATADNGWKATVVVDSDGTTGISPAEYKASCCGVKPTCASKFYSCPAGYKRDTTTTNIGLHFCATLDASSCAATTAWDDGVAGNGAGAQACCKKDTLKCGGLTVSCPAGRYFPDSLKNSAAKAGNQNTNCCSAVATCAVATCPSGWKAKATAAALSCPKDAASCVKETCCEKDTTKCGGLSAIVCAAGFYDESNGGAWTAKTKQAVKDAWNNKPATEATKNTACCTAKAVCAAPATTAAPGATIVTTTPAAAATTVTTTPAAPALKFSEHKVAVEKGSHGAWATNMVWLGVGGLVGMSVLMIVQHLRSRMDGTQANVREVDNLLLDNTSLE